MAVRDSARNQAREDFCRFLAACYYEPCAAFEEEKLFESMQAAAALLDPELHSGAQRLGDAFKIEGQETLLLDYTRLFLGPTGALARPYGCVWLTGDGSLMQDSTVDVLELYREGGFELDEDFRELPDHIAAELEFLYLLIFRKNRAASHSGNGTGTSEDIDSIRSRFLAEHLGKWAGPFTAAVQAGAQSAFYRELADLTQRFVRAEAETGGK